MKDAKMGTQCRRYTSDDTSALADLFLELQEYHDLPKQSRNEILSDIEIMPAGFEVWLAEDDDGSVVGFALASVYPGPGIAAGLYLKELFVTLSARKGGIGRALIGTLAQSAVKRGFKRMDWVTTYDNTKAREFYDRLGATADENKVFYRADHEALAMLATNTADGSDLISEHHSLSQSHYTGEV